MNKSQPTDTYELFKNRTLERPIFPPHHIVTDQDMKLLVQFPLEKQRQHNRLLHGWGIICGAKPVLPPPIRLDDPKWDSSYKLLITPGYLLDSFGNIIWIPREVIVDVRDDETTGYAIGPSSEMVDPWCSQVKRERKPDDKLYIAIKYAEYEARPVRKLPGGCGCDDNDCNNTRIYDSFTIRPLTRLPATYTDPLVAPDWDPAKRCDDDCPECGSDPWVILACVHVNAQGKVEISENTDELRRYVISFANYFYLCPRGTTAGATAREVGFDRKMAQEMLEEMLDKTSFDSLDGDLSRIPYLRATDMVGVGRSSPLGGALQKATMSIEEVAMTDQDAFIKRMVDISGVEAAKQAAFERQAGEIWDRSRRVIALTKALQG